tara:strand:+ start:155 stop:841 length:687 start_codon:yes stop_codon:yes gene_type:complete
MATRPEDLQNWSLWDFDEKPNFKFQTGNPTYGFGGGTVFGQQMEQNNQTAHWGMTEDGQMNLFNDDTITISGGNTKDGGTCVNIVGKNGDVTITAMKNGDIKIKGSNITIDADENINIQSSKNVRIKGGSSIFFDTPNLNTNAMTGNLAPRNVTFGGLVFRGTKVGQGAISNAFTGGDIGSVASELSSKAKTDLKDIAGNIDTSGLSAQANQAKSALSDALSNFGGFG